LDTALPPKAVSTVSALLCVAAIGGLATMSTANAGCKFGAQWDDVDFSND
jgi:hypothetical protein